MSNKFSYEKELRRRERRDTKLELREKKRMLKLEKIKEDNG